MIKKLSILMICFILFSGMTVPKRRGYFPTRALDFDGKDEIDFGASSPVEELPQITLMAWVYHHTDTTDDQIMNNNDTVNGMSFARTNTNDTYFWRVERGNVSVSMITATNSAKAGTWHFLCGRFIGGSTTGLRLNLDGIEITPVSTASVANTGNSNQEWMVGNNDQYNNYFDGIIAIPTVWNVSLSATEVMELYRGRDPGSVRPNNIIQELKFLDNNIGVDMAEGQIVINSARNIVMTGVASIKTTPTAGMTTVAINLPNRG